MKSGLLSVLILVAVVAVQHAVAQTRLPDHWYTSGGIDLGRPDWQDITDAEGAVRFTDPQDVKLRKAAKLSDRYAEQITLRNNATLNYTRLYSSRDDFGNTGVEQAAVWLKNVVASKFYADRGIQYDDRQVKRAGELAYLVQSTGQATCFAYKALLGDSRRKDQDIYGGVCSPSSRTATALEQEMLLLLSHARFAVSMDNSSFTASLQIPETLVPPTSSSSAPNSAASPTGSTGSQLAVNQKPMAGRDALPYLEGRWTSTDCNTSYTEFKFTRPDRLEAVYNYVYLPDSRKNLRDERTQIRFDDKGGIIVYWPDTGYTVLVEFHGPDLRETTDTDKEGKVLHRVYQRCK
jgi:hypothetical protein